jgi:hypothetical protein
MGCNVQLPVHNLSGAQDEIYAQTLHPTESQAWNRVSPPQVNKEICDGDWRCNPPPGGLCSLCAKSISCALTPPSINHLMKDRGKFIVAG